MATTFGTMRVLQGYEADAKSVLALAESSAGERLERLSLGSFPLDAVCARALASMPSLGWLSLGFPEEADDAPAILARRFGPFLNVWGHHRDWAKLPGPE